MSTGEPEASGPSGSNTDLSNLQENINRQQAKISALKELVRKSEAAQGKSNTSAQEKVKNIAQRLSHIKLKARSRQNLDSSVSSTGELRDDAILEECVSPTPPQSAQKARIETAGSEKFQLLRRQVEESKLKMAERENSKREIEELVTQLKAKFDSTQQSLERSSELGRSMGDLTILSAGSTKEKFKSASDLSFTPLNLDKEKIKFLENRIKLLEKQIEKQTVNILPASESEQVSMLKNRILDLEENLREKECIIEARTQAVTLMSENLSAKGRTTVDTLEDTRLEMAKMQQNFVESESEFRAEVAELKAELEEKCQKIRNLEEINDILETARFDLTVKNSELENKIQDVLEYSTKLDELNKLNEALQNKINNLEEQLTEKTVECNVLNANFSVLQEKLKAATPKSLFSQSGDEEAEIEIRKLKEQLDEANKSMIKVKLKSKQLQKQVDKFKKISDVNSEAIRLTEENQELQMRIAELEEEKGSLQLKLLSGTSDTERVPETELEKKVQVLETMCQNQTSAIQLLEEQKLELQERTQQQDEKTSTSDVSSQIESLQIDEQAAEQVAQLQSDLDKLRTENASLRDEIRTLDDEKQELGKKVDHYLSENIELLDKVEKLSKSSSSAESIEIVEQLTQQEKLEMEAFNKKMSSTHEHEPSEIDAKVHAAEQTKNLMGPELSDSLAMLREESLDLKHRIELFTTERREVLEKMERLSGENQELQRQIDELREEKSTIEDSLTKSKLEVVALEEKLDIAIRERCEIDSQLNEANELKLKLEKELKSLAKMKEVATTMASSISTPNPEIVDGCSKSVAQLTAELENYRKSNDKSGRLNASKKLAKEAKNVCQQVNDLLVSLKEVSAATGAVDLATVDQSDTVDELEQKRVELEEIVEKLRNELTESKESVEQKDNEIAALNKRLDELRESHDQLQQAQSDEIGNLEYIRKELDAKLGAADNEINILKTLVSEQKQQLIDAYTEHEIELNAKIIEIEKYEEQVAKLQSDLASLKSESSKSNDHFVSQLKKDIKKLENALSANKLLITEQSEDLSNKQATIETLNTQIIDLYKTMEENSNKVLEKDDEIAYLQELLDTNKMQAESLAKENDENKQVIERLLVQLHEHKSSAEKADGLVRLEEQNAQLELSIKLLENVKAELESKNREHVEKLKKFAANLKRKTAQCSELETKLKSASLVASETPLMPDQQNVIHALQQEIKSYQDQIQTLQSSDRAKFEQEACEHEMFALRKERDSNLENYRNVTADYERVQVELATYKAKVELFERSIGEVQALADVLHGEIAAKESEIANLRSQIQTVQAELEHGQQKFVVTSEELKQKNLKFEKSKAIIKEKNREIQRLKDENEELLKSRPATAAEIVEEAKLDTDELTKLKAEYERLSETSEAERETLQQTITRLETLYDGIQAKFNENAGYIEAIEDENINYKEKIIKLENCIAAFEERRLSFQRHSDMLDAQLQKRTDEFERNEDALIYRLNKLMDHDDTIGERLVQAEEDKQEIAVRFEQLQAEHAEVLQQLNRVEKELEQLKTDELEQLKMENDSLKDTLEITQSEMARQQNIYEGRLSKKHSEIDDLENELSVQLNSINQEKRGLQESLERSQDELVELKDEIVRLKENVTSLEQTRNDLEREATWIRMQNENMSQDQYELQELRMQSIQDKTEVENLKHQIESLIQNHDIELNALRQQIKELDSVRMQVGQNQTDDQVFIETENKRLKEQLAEKELAIESYQRENLKLQMASMMSGHGAGDPFSGSGQPASIDSSAETNSLRERVRVLEDEVARLQLAINEKDQLYNAAVQEMQVAKDQLASLQQEFSAMQRQRAVVSEIVAPSHYFSNLATEPSSSVFEELAQNIDPSAHGQTDQKKIEDLERNVSDLDKHATDLESKLKNLTAVHENTLLQLQEQIRRFEETVKEYEARIKVYEDKQKELEVQKSVESMIVTDSSAVETLPSVNMFFSATPQQPAAEFDRLVAQPTQPASDSTDAPIPVQEPLIVPKKAYVTHPESESIELGTEEGWGWGSEEATLEERHQQQLMQSQPPVEKYKERIDELQLERDRANQKTIELQVKCGKLMKKLKEYKARIDQLESDNRFRKSTSVESSDLDLAIQDELKSQVQRLEESIAEMRKQHDKDATEKENLTKRVDVLTSANERMTEMKERQDSEVKSLESKVRQLSQQLKKLESWGDQYEVAANQPESAFTSAQSRAEADELKAKLKNATQDLEDVRVDRDELQALLDDEKNNVRLSERRIDELKEKIASLEVAAEIVDNRTDKLSSLETELQNLRNLVAEKEADLSNATQTNRNLQSQLNDYQSTIEQLSTESTSIQQQLSRLQANYEEKIAENLQLAQDLKLSMSKSETCSKELEALKSKSDATLETTTTAAETESKIQELVSQLQYKEAEIMHLKQKIQDAMQEDQTQSLVQEILGKNQEIVQLRMHVQQLEAEKTELENNLSIQITQQMSQKPSNSDESQERIKTLEKELLEIKDEKQQMETELEVLNNHVLESLDLEEKMKQTILEIDTKNIEIAELRNSLETLRSQQSHHPQSTSDSADFEARLVDINAEWERRVEQKCSEIAESWRQYMDQREAEFKETENNLNLKIEQLRAGIVVPKRKTPEEIELESSTEAVENETMRKMQAALEAQELEIVTLKEQLAIRSAEYARLAAKHDPYAMSSTSSNLSFDSSATTKTPRKLSTSSSGNVVIDQPAAVPKSELDLALYMLHQRDMRCEELTLELMSLLEERDTLQLKLSNSLRQIEDIKHKTSFMESGSESEQPSSSPNTPERSGKSKTTTDSDVPTDDLNSKLSQLQTVRYAKDKSIREEREERQRQMENIHQAVANIPSDAVSELVGSDISNQMLSPSNVLLDWLWGNNKNNSQQS